MRQDLFAQLHSPYYLYSPAFSSEPGEANTLHYLCHALNLAGEEAYVTDVSPGTLRTPRVTQDIINGHIKNGRNPIMLYPQTIKGNPLSAPNVIRYLVGAPERQTREEMQWGTEDVIYAQAEEWIPAHMQASLLATPAINAPQLQEQFWQQLENFIGATQQRFNQNKPPVQSTTPSAAASLPSINATPVRRKRALVYSVESTWSPCPQIRLIRPFAHLQNEWELVWGIQNGQLQTDPIDGADLIILHRFTPGLMALASLKAIFDLGKPVIYESDDLLNEIPHDHPEAAAGAGWKAGIEYAVQHAKAVVVSTQFLAEKYRKLNPNVHVLPNYIDYDIFYRPVPQRTDGNITIGLLGSSIQPSNFALVDAALRTLVEHYGSRLHIYFVGWECPKGWEHHPQTTFLSFVHEYVNYAAQLKEWNWDIALIPLASDEYNQCKSYIKWLDYSAAGIASVFSDVSVYNEVVTHDRTGLLMPNSSEAWLDSITMLIESPEKRHALAIAGQQEVCKDYGLKEKSKLYSQVYRSLI